MMTGGVSKNKGLVKTLEEKLGTKLVISDKAQLCGALIVQQTRNFCEQK